MLVYLVASRFSRLLYIMLEEHNLTFIFNGLLLLWSKYADNVQSMFLQQ